MFDNQCTIYFQNNPSKEKLENFVNGDIYELLENRCN